MNRLDQLKSHLNEQQKQFQQEDLNKKVLIIKKGQILNLKLNNPQRLNALDSEMIQQILDQFLQIKNFPFQYSLIIVESDIEKAFAAGGDARNYRDYFIQKKFDQCKKTFETSTYLQQIQKEISEIPQIQTVALMNSYVIGGGYGHFSNFNFKICTENSIFSMPEVFIGGNIPNILILSKLPKKYLSLYLIITGFQIKGEELVQFGVCNCFMNNSKFNNFKQKLSSLVDQSQFLALVSQNESQVGLLEKQKEETIKKLFDFDDFFDFWINLQNTLSINQTNDPTYQMALSVQNRIQQSSAISLRINFEWFFRANKMSKQEYFETQNKLIGFYMKEGEFAEGFYANVMQKGKVKPKFLFESPLDISTQTIENIFNYKY